MLSAGVWNVLPGCWSAPGNGPLPPPASHLRQESIRPGTLISEKEQRCQGHRFLFKILCFLSNSNEMDPGLYLIQVKFLSRLNSTVRSRIIKRLKLNLAFRLIMLSPGLLDSKIRVDISKRLTIEVMGKH